MLQIYYIITLSGVILYIASCQNDKRCEINQKAIISKGKLLVSTVIYTYVRHDVRDQDVLNLAHIYTHVL